MTTAVDRMDLHAQRPHQPSRGDADAAESQDTADFAGQGAVAAELIEFATREGRMLDQKPFRGGENHGQSVLRHRFGVSPAVAGDRYAGRERVQRHEIDAGGYELDQSRGSNVLGLARSQVLAGVAGQNRRSVAQGKGS